MTAVRAPTDRRSAPAHAALAWQVDEAELRSRARDGEPDRYLAALLAPAEARTGLLAVAAFAADVERIAREVRDPMLGEIRLQWWRDAVDAGARGERSGHPIADALAHAVARHGLPVSVLHRIVDARSSDVARETPADDAALDDHLAATEGLAFALGVVVLADADAAASPALRRAGIAYGLARNLGRLPALLRHGSFPIPATRLAAAGITIDDLAERAADPAVAGKLDTIVRGLELVARAALDDARRDLALLVPRARAALLPLAMVEPYLAAQNARVNERMTAILEPTPLGRAWRLWRASRRGF